MICSYAQSVPVEWLRYTGEDYLYDVQQDNNTGGLSETQFKKKLLEAAYTSLAKKVKVQVIDFARMSKGSVNGKTNVSYASVTEFFTDVNLTLSDSKFKYDALSKDGTVIVYINKPAACMYYRNAVKQSLGRADNALESAGNYIDKGFKESARKELEAVLPEFKKLEEPFFWLNFFGTEPEDILELQEDCNSHEQAVKNMLADLKHGTKIYLSCKADLFGQPYTELEKVLKGMLSSEVDCSFSDTKAEADWIIIVSASAREYNAAVMGGVTSYFSYADTSLSIYKVATSQMIYEDRISAKGGHTLSFDESGRTAYRNLTSKISEQLIINIKE